MREIFERWKRGGCDICLSGKGSSCYYERKSVESGQGNGQVGVHHIMFRCPNDVINGHLLFAFTWIVKNESKNFF